jgi:type IV pilus assembly protein PilC
MPVFTFTGTDAAGEAVKGERVAENKDVLKAALRRERITPGAIKEKGKEFALPTFGKGGGKVGTKDVAIFFRQFSVMIDAGLPLVQCLEILGANQENPFFMKTLNGVRTTVEGGSTLANAMRNYPKVFDDLTTNMIEAGETGGILDVILQRLATYVEKAVKLKAAVKSAMIYPISVITMAAGVVGALLKFVVPIFANLFKGLGVELPLPTRMVMGLCRRLRPCIRREADSRKPQGPLFVRQNVVELAGPGNGVAEDCRGPIYANAWYPDHLRRAHYRRPFHHSQNVWKRRP